MKKYMTFTVLLVALGLLAGCGQHIASASAAEPDTQQAVKPDDRGFLQKMFAQSKPVVIPEGTPVSVRLQTSISSATSNPGDRFDLVLTEPLIVGGITVAPAGTN